MTNLETKEIRGLNLRTLIALIVCTISICATVLGTYFSNQAELREIKLTMASDSRLNEFKLKGIEIRIDGIEARYREILYKYDEIQKQKQQP